MIVAFPFDRNANWKIGELFVGMLCRASIWSVQCTDEKTEALPGVKEVIRHSNGNFGSWYFEVMQKVPHKQYLRLDYDTYLKHDVADVFDLDFDIAVAKEIKGVVNTGVMFVKKTEFFGACLENFQKTGMAWHDIQIATQMTIDEGLFRVRKLEPNIYHYMPNVPGLIRSPDVRIVHYEGPERKKWIPGM